MTHDRLQIYPRDDFADDALVEESHIRAAERLATWWTTFDRQKSPQHEVFQPSEGHNFDGR